jgi:hypothetical protein
VIDRPSLDQKSFVQELHECLTPDLDRCSSKFPMLL